MNDKFWKAVMALLVVGFIGNALVSWRTVAVLENDVHHLTQLVQETRQDVREIWSRLRME